MALIWSKFKWLISGIFIILLLVLVVIFKNNKIQDLITKLMISRVDREEEKIDIALDNAIKQGELKKKEVDNMSMDDRASFYNERYGK